MSYADRTNLPPLWGPLDGGGAGVRKADSFYKKNSTNDSLTISAIPARPLRKLSNNNAQIQKSKLSIKTVKS